MANYVFGSGRVFIGPEGALSGFIFLGNVPSLDLSYEKTSLAIQAPNASGVLEHVSDQVTAVAGSAQMVVDDLTDTALELLFGQALTTATQGVSAESGYAIPSAIPGYTYQLGATSANPTGHKNVSSVVVGGAGAPYFDGIDYSFDAEKGRITILQGGSISEGDSLTVDYNAGQSEWSRAVPGALDVRRAVYFEADNQKGINRDLLIPVASIRSTSPLPLIADNLSSMQFDINVKLPSQGDSLYLDGRPV